jgi:hypothetical protein
MDTSSMNSPYFVCYQAAQVKAGDRGFLSRDITVDALLLNRADVHHLYPREYLKGLNLSRGTYNQIANYVIAQSEINIAIGAKAPSVYFSELAVQINSGQLKYGGITSREDVVRNFEENCIPLGMLDGQIKEFPEFLEERRRLMSLKLKTWFDSL